MNKITAFIPICLLALAGLHLAQTGYVVAGSTKSYTHGTGDQDFLLYRLDAQGAVLWQKNLGGTAWDTCRSMQQTIDGGYVLAGYNDSYTHGGSDFLIYKLDGNGDKQWRKNLGGEESDTAHSIRQTSDGGYIICGSTSSYTHGTGDSDFLIYKLGADGSKEWRKNLGGIGDDRAGSIRQTSDGGYVAAGGTDSYTHGDSDFLVYKLRVDGSKEWRKNLGGIKPDGASSIRQTSDGGYVVAGISQSYTHGFEDGLVYKLSAGGAKLWRKHYGGANTDWIDCIQQTSDGGYVTAGASWTYSNGSADILVYKLDSAGGKQWRKNFGGYTLDRSLSIWQTSDGGYVTAGVTLSYSPDTGEADFIVYKLDPDGIKQWRKNYGGPLSDAAYSIQETK